MGKWDGVTGGMTSTKIEVRIQLNPEDYNAIKEIRVRLSPEDYDTMKRIALGDAEGKSVSIKNESFTIGDPVYDAIIKKMKSDKNYRSF